MLRKGRKTTVEVVSLDTKTGMVVLRDQNGTEYHMIMRDINGKPVTWIPNWYPLIYLKDYAKDNSIEVNGDLICKVARELENYKVYLSFSSYVDEILGMVPVEDYEDEL